MPSAEESLDYILTVLKHTELPQPNYHAIATETGASNANVAQKRFKAIIESRGFLFVNKQIVGKDGTRSGTGGGAGGPVQGPKKAAVKKKGVAAPKSKGAPKGNASRKRKRDENGEDGGAEKNNDDEQGTESEEGEDMMEIKEEDVELGNGRARSETVEGNIEIDEKE